MKIIFLDFDGVITTRASKYSLIRDKMLIVKDICDKTGAKIVISSSWRRYTLEDTIKHITDTSCPYVSDNPFIMPELVVGITDRMYAFKYSEPDKHYLVHRGEEIKRYLIEHKDDNITHYVIIDDDADMLLEQQYNFVQIYGEIGITETDAERCIEILKR